MITHQHHTHKKKRETIMSRSARRILAVWNSHGRNNSTSRLSKSTLYLRTFSATASSFRTPSTSRFLNEPAESLLNFDPSKYEDINVLPDPPVRLYAAPNEVITTEELFPPNQRVVVFGIPGPFIDDRLSKAQDFTNEKLPHFLDAVPNILQRKVDKVVSISVNDPWQQRMWSQDLHVEHCVLMLADPDAAFTRHIGMEVDLRALGHGIRTRRFSIIVDNRKVMFFNVERDPSQILKTSSVMVLDQLDLLNHTVKKRTISSREWTHDSLKREVMDAERKGIHHEPVESEKGVPSMSRTKSQF